MAVFLLGYRDEERQADFVEKRHTPLLAMMASFTNVTILTEI